MYKSYMLSRANLGKYSQIQDRYLAFITSILIFLFLDIFFKTIFQVYSHTYQDFHYVFPLYFLLALDHKIIYNAIKSAIC